MLKAKTQSPLTKRKSEALKAVLKDDFPKPIYAEVTKAEKKKLDLHLVQEGITLANWVKQKINEIGE